MSRTPDAATVSCNSKSVALPFDAGQKYSQWEITYDEVGISGVFPSAAGRVKKGNL